LSLLDRHHAPAQIVGTSLHEGLRTHAEDDHGEAADGYGVLLACTTKLLHVIISAGGVIMTDVVSENTRLSDDEYKTVLDHLLGEIEVINAQMQQDQVDIERLRAESALYRTEAQLLKVEGELIDFDNRSRLSNLGMCQGR
jgi:hypothetical protein